MKWVKHCFSGCTEMSGEKCQWMSWSLKGDLCPVLRMTERGGQSSSSLAFVKTCTMRLLLWKIRYCPFICTERTSLYTASVGSLVTDRKSAHWDSYQWRLFKASAGACTVPSQWPVSMTTPPSIHLRMLATKWEKSPEPQISLTRSTPCRWATTKTSCTLSEVWSEKSCIFAITVT